MFSSTNSHDACLDFCHATGGHALPPSSTERVRQSRRRRCALRRARGDTCTPCHRLLVMCDPVVNIGSRVGASRARRRHSSRRQRVTAWDRWPGPPRSLIPTCTRAYPWNALPGADAGVRSVRRVGAHVRPRRSGEFQSECALIRVQGWARGPGRLGVSERAECPVRRWHPRRRPVTGPVTTARDLRSSFSTHSFHGRSLGYFFQRMSSLIRHWARRRDPQELSYPHRQTASASVTERCRLRTDGTGARGDLRVTARDASSSSCSQTSWRPSRTTALIATRYKCLERVR